MPKGYRGVKRTPEETREYMRNYMKGVRDRAKAERQRILASLPPPKPKPPQPPREPRTLKKMEIKRRKPRFPPEGPYRSVVAPGEGGARGSYSWPRDIVAANAAYDPKRDGRQYHTDRTAEFCGDPLPGRSALDQMLARGKPVEVDPADLPIKSVGLTGGAYCHDAQAEGSAEEHEFDDAE